MTAIEVKIFLLRRGLSIHKLAYQIAEPNQSPDSLRVMLSQMIHGQRYYPALAKKVKEHCGLNLKRPAQERRYLKAA